MDFKEKLYQISVGEASPIQDHSTQIQQSGLDQHTSPQSYPQETVRAYKKARKTGKKKDVDRYKRLFVCFIA